MGITDDDRVAAWQHVPATSETAALLEKLSARAPERSVEVAPFLCAVRPLLAPEVARLTQGRVEHDMFTWPEACDLASELALRLPTEIELEWLARDGRGLPFALDVARLFDEGALPRARSRFGVHDLLEPQWSSARWDGQDEGVYRGYFAAGIQSRDELLLALSGARYRGREDEAALRLVADIPS